MAIAQNIEKPSQSTNPSLNAISISGQSYPIFLNGEEHSSFMVKYGISKSTQLELQGFYDTYLMSNRFRTCLVGKAYVNDKLYVFSGLDVEIDIAKYGQRSQAPRLGVVSGVGYDSNENFMLEAKSIIQLNNSKVGSYGESLVPMPSVFILGSKFKF
jgi:hypothetical protein